MKVRNMLHILAIYGATIGFTTAHAFECDNNPNVTCETSSYFTSYQFRHPALESELGERTAEGIKVGPLDQFRAGCIAITPPMSSMGPGQLEVTVGMKSYWSGWLKGADEAWQTPAYNIRVAYRDDNQQLRVSSKGVMVNELGTATRYITNGNQSYFIFDDDKVVSRTFQIQYLHTEVNDLQVEVCNFFSGAGGTLESIQAKFWLTDPK
jgi:hypothetical protein